MLCIFNFVKMFTLVYLLLTEIWTGFLRLNYLLIWIILFFDLFIDLTNQL